MQASKPARGYVLRQCVLAGLLLSGCLVSSAQEFEAASVRPSPPLDPSNGPVFFGSRGGPGTDAPVRYWCNFCDISDLVAKAYGIPEYRLVVAPRLPSGRFHVVATMAPGTTEDRFRQMLQNLLAERFGLSVHREKREMRTYRLLLSRRGVQLKPHVEGAAAESASRSEKAPIGYRYKTQATLAEFAQVLENQLKKPVVDATGLTGTYDFDLSWSLDDLEAGESSPSDLPSLPSAIRSAGLEMDSHKEQIDVLVVDKVAPAFTTD